jgi:hypothetical protein
MASGMIRFFAGRVTRSIGTAPGSASDQGFPTLERFVVVREARLMAYLDVFVVFALMTLLAFSFVFLMKRSVAEGGAAMH